MAITDVINGTDVIVFISPSTGTTTWKAVAHATSHTLSIKMATRITSNKGSGIIETRDKGRLDVTGTLEGMYIDTDQYNIEDFVTIMTTRVPVLMIFGKETTALSGVPETTIKEGAHS